MQLPMLYLIGFFVTFVMGGLTGVMVAVVPFDWQAHDTAFVTAHLHYVLVGGFVFPMLAGAYYWLPHFTGRQRTFRLGELAFWLIFIGFHATFFLLHLAGLLGQPRRVVTYPGDVGWTWMNLISSVGGFVMAIGFALFAIDVALQLFLSRRSPRNPWQAGTLEWAMMIPPPAYNIASLPTVASREPGYDTPDLANRLARGEGYLGEARHHWREVLAVDLKGRIRHIIVLPGNTRLPIVTAVVTGAFFLSLLFGYYWLALLPMAGVTALAWRWAWVLGSRRDVGMVSIGRGQTAPIHREVRGSPGWWGGTLLLVSDGTLFASLLFGYAFLWVIAPNWPPPVRIDGGILPSLIAAAAAVGGALLIHQAHRRVAAEALDSARPLALGAAVAQLGVMAALVALGASALPAPQSHAYAAASWALIVYGVLHAFIALFSAAFVYVRIGAGYVSAARSQEAATARMFAGYSAATTILVLLCLLVPEVLA